MASYTEDVRKILYDFCVQYSKKILTSPDDIISFCAEHDFPLGNKWGIFDEKYRVPLAKKILSHYYMREIGAETDSLWIWWIQTRLNEIMPYYNQMYESELKKYDIFTDTDFTHEYTKKVKSESHGTHSDSSSANKTEEINGETTQENTTASKTNATTLHNDTPQGGIQGIIENQYLSDATIATSNDESITKLNGNNVNNNSANETNESSGTTNNNQNSDEAFSERTHGKINSKSFPELIKEWRESFLNIDMMVINELNDLFFGLW